MLFSAVKQTHWALGARDTGISDWLSLAHFEYQLNLQHCTYSSVWLLLYGWCHVKLMLFQRIFCVHHTTMHHVTSCKATYVRCMRWAVTCHLHFWQNGRGLLRATAVTQGWNGYQNKSQHRKLTLEKKILLPLQQGFEPTTFRSRVWRSNHWATPAPQSCQSTVTAAKYSHHGKSVTIAQYSHRCKAVAKHSHHCKVQSLQKKSPPHNTANAVKESHHKVQSLVLSTVTNAKYSHHSKSVTTAQYSHRCNHQSTVTTEKQSPSHSRANMVKESHHKVQSLAQSTVTNAKHSHHWKAQPPLQSTVTTVKYCHCY